MAEANKIVNQADQSDGTKLPSHDLACQFSAMPVGDDKSKFFHDNPSLGLLFNAVHFPKPAALSSTNGAEPRLGKDASATT